MRARILVAGGGIMGVSIAQRCAQRTVDPNREAVVLLERRQLGAGSSGRSGAILRQHYHDPVVARMARDSLREYASFEMRTGNPIGFQRTGVLTLAGPHQPEWCERIRANVAMLRDLGVDTRIPFTIHCTICPPSYRGRAASGLIQCSADGRLKRLRRFRNSALPQMRKDISA
jgi:sarcosine oxidase subunit beta